MAQTKKWGMILLPIWLILTGLSQLIDIPIPFLGVVLGILAIAAGVLLLLGK